MNTNVYQVPTMWQALTYILFNTQNLPKEDDIGPHYIDNKEWSSQRRYTM